MALAKCPAVQLEDFIERNRCKLFIKSSSQRPFVPAWDSFRVVGSAMPADHCGPKAASSGEPCRRYFLQLEVVRRTDCQSCLRDLCDLSLRNERNAWLLLWVLTANRRFLARLDANKVILQGALIHRTFWLTAREDSHLEMKKGPDHVPKFDSLLPMVKPLLGRLPDRMVTVSLTWLPWRVELKPGQTDLPAGNQS